MSEETVYCAGCGCELAPYEVFAARIRGLKQPVCVGCAYEAIVFLRDYLLPLVETTLEMLTDEQNHGV